MDLNVIHQIKTEAFQNPKVMDTVFQLTDVYGPRLTNSPQFRAAGEWAVKQLKEFGLDNVKLEKWGPFGRGWAYTSYSGYIDEPQYQPLIGYPLAWTPGTDGPLTAEAVLAPIRTEADLDQYKGKLRGKIVLRDAPRILSLPTDPAGRRLSDAQLADLSVFPIPAPPGRAARAGQPPFNPQQARKSARALQSFLEGRRRAAGGSRVQRRRRRHWSTAWVRTASPRTMSRPSCSPRNTIIASRGCWITSFPSSSPSM